MEKSKRFDDVIKLGKRLVDELGLDQSVDTLGRWMAHHIADLMTAAQISEGPEKQEAEDRCRGAVLALWRHNGALQKGHTPLEETETLFKTIRALDPESNEPFYYSQAQQHLHKHEIDEENAKWFELSLGLDYTARMLISLCLKQAANDVMRGNEEWLELARSLDADTPRTQIIRFLFDDTETSEQALELKKFKDKYEALKGRKERLGSFLDLARMLEEKLSEDIKKLESNI